MPTTEELQLEKLRHEVEKLKIEVGNMGRPMRAFWNNPASYFTALSLMIGFAAYMGQSYVNDAKAEKSKTELLLTELRKKELDQDNESLAKKRDALNSDTQRVWSEYADTVAQRDKLREEVTALRAQISGAQEELKSKGVSSAKLNAAADQAKGIDVSRVPTILEARIYIQVASREDKVAAQQLAAALRDKGRTVPDIEIVGASAANLKQTELRYFWPFDEAEAREILTKVEESGKYGKVELKFPAALKGKSRPRHFELWIKPT